MYPRKTLDISQVLKRILSIPTFISFVIVSGIIIVLITGFDIDIGKVMSIILEAGPIPFALAFITHYLSFVFRGLRWKFLVGDIDSKTQPSSLEYIKLIYLSNFINSASLFRIGDLYKVYAFDKKYSKGFTNLLGTLITERLLDCVMLAILVGVFGQVLIQTSNKEIQMLILLPVVLLGILLLAFIAVSKIKNIPKFPLLTNLIQKAKEGAQIPKKDIPPAFLMSVLAWLCDIIFGSRNAHISANTRRYRSSRIRCGRVRYITIKYDTREFYSSDIIGQISHLPQCPFNRRGRIYMGDDRTKQKR